MTHTSTLHRCLQLWLWFHASQTPSSLDPGGLAVNEGLLAATARPLAQQAEGGPSERIIGKSMVPNEFAVRSLNGLSSLILPHL